MQKVQKKLKILDSTLRDGAQGEGISFSVEDKLKILEKLDDFGISFVEAGNPSSNPKDLEFFRNALGRGFENSSLVAFGSTVRKGIKPEDDESLAALIEAGTDYVTVFGKCWDMHATEILGVSLDENLRMIFDTIKYVSDNGKHVFFDAEHFFDGYKNNPEYALNVLKTAEKAGAETLVLCDTNGGCFPEEISAGVKAAAAECGVEIGIHCHNDTGCAVANTIAAVESGAVHIEGTFTGFGERCGNANLSTIIPDLQLKLGYATVPDEKIEQLTETARFIAEIANTKLPSSMPYVGISAFAHKGGMHADGVAKNPRSFEHIKPELVGNERNFLLSEVAGRAAVLSKLNKFDPTLTKDSDVTKRIIARLKQLESKGYQFEAANASVELLILRELGKFSEYFEVVDYKVISSNADEGDKALANALIKVKVGSRYEITADEGKGPVNAIDLALRKALEVFYPALSRMYLIDYKVRVLNTGLSTAAVTRVLIESTDGKSTWTTVGASEDIIRASMQALTDSLEYMLMKSKVYNYMC